MVKYTELEKTKVISPGLRDLGHREEEAISHNKEGMTTSLLRIKRDEFLR